MDWTEVLQEIFYVCIIPLLGVLTGYLVQFLKAKGAQIAGNTDSTLAAKYIKMLTDTVCTCVVATNQTYVEALKKEGKFDAAAQKKAFQMTYNTVLGILSEDAKEYLTNLYGDLDTFLTNKIEEQVKSNK